MIAEPESQGSASSLQALFAAALQQHQAGNSSEAVGALRTLIGRMPTLAEAHYTLGLVLISAGRLVEAVAALRIASCLQPGSADIAANLGSALGRLGRFDDVVVVCRVALRLQPDLALAYSNLGNALTTLGRLREAVTSFRAAILLTPDNALAPSNLGCALQRQGLFDPSVASFTRAIALDPDFAAAHSNLIMGLHYRSQTDGPSILAAARRFAARFEARRPPRRFADRASACRRLRIGYVSGDFGRHPVGYFLSPVIVNHDPAAVEVFCYSNSLRQDDVTARLQDAADHWRSLVGLSDDAAAALILADRIDILIDLSGHTEHNRLPMFALKPAPLQLTWLGFWGTTGLSTMDYILSDDVTIPTGEEHHYSERILRLPRGRFCYRPPDDAPSPAPHPPVVRRGSVTFGSFNNLSKVGPEVVSLWARVLIAIPGSRLILKWGSFNDQGVCRRFRDAFAAEGVAAERLLLRSASPHAAMLAEYADIDIALDPFPFSGGLTSCEALWMGVPVITLPCAGPASRQTMSFLRALDLTEWVAATKSDYVTIATALAATPDRLEQLRQDLRRLMSASPLCDGDAFARQLEATLQRIWTAWCRNQR